MATTVLYLDLGGDEPILYMGEVNVLPTVGSNLKVVVSENEALRRVATGHRCYNDMQWTVLALEFKYRLDGLSRNWCTEVVALLRRMP
jgi:hypothetical protein